MRFVAASCGAYHTIAITSNGEVYFISTSINLNIFYFLIIGIHGGKMIVGN